MSIVFDSDGQNFILSTRNTSYVIHLVDGKYLQHVYWGKKVDKIRFDPMERYPVFGPGPHYDKQEMFLEALAQEYPTYGAGDLRSPALQLQLPDGSTITELLYKRHRILPGKPSLTGLPATYTENDNEAETLEITLYDSLIGLTVVLTYSVFEAYDAITRSAFIHNTGNDELKLLRALSMNVDFFTSDYRLLQLSGAWARERVIHTRPLLPGSQSIESRRGASSAQQNPFIALLENGSTEDTGNVYGLNLVYSGSFLANVEVDHNGTSRVQMGINPFDFSWLLKRGESFQTPETVMVYSSEGLGGMSRIYHRLYRERLCRGKYRDIARPVLLNNWEATYFDFNEEKLLKIAKQAKDLGVELFVLDDGWFGRRDDDHTSLGDWYVDKRKLPNGLKGLAQKVREMELQFGLWFEPEMISPDSELYRAHPDWCLHVKGRECTQGRHQLILDLSRQEVCDYIVDLMKQTLSTVPISYVKWDMNRNFTEVGSVALPPERQRETAHRYMLGLYRMMEELTTCYPDILFEGCASGGGRYDPGILYYMPQFWTSDDTDAIERLYIQYGTSVVYPLSTMSAHVSAVPNHQVGRITPLKTRGDCALTGSFGYELDVTRMSDEEKEQVKEQIRDYHLIADTVRMGDFYRLLSPFEGNFAAWMVVSPDKREAVVSFFIKLAQPLAPMKILKLKGLDPEALYCIDGGKTYSGAELMNIGLLLPRTNGDFASQRFVLKRV